MQSAGVLVFSGGLHASSSATVLRHQYGDIVLTDGPFIESKELIGGITIVRVPDLDAALLWARKLARANCSNPLEARLSPSCRGSRFEPPTENQTDRQLGRSHKPKACLLQSNICDAGADT
jgi:hypothetical protein